MLNTARQDQIAHPLIGDLMTKKKRTWLIVQNLVVQLIILVAFYIFGPPTIDELEGYEGCSTVDPVTIHRGFCSSARLNVTQINARVKAGGLLALLT